MDQSLLLVGGLHKRLRFNFNNSLLVFVSVFLSLPNSLHHHYFWVFTPADNTEIFLLVSGSHNKFNKWSRLVLPPILLVKVALSLWPFFLNKQSSPHQVPHPCLSHNITPHEWQYLSYWRYTVTTPLIFDVGLLVFLLGFVQWLSPPATSFLMAGCIAWFCWAANAFVLITGGIPPSPPIVVSPWTICWIALVILYWFSSRWSLHSSIAAIYATTWLLTIFTLWLVQTLSQQLYILQVSKIQCCSKQLYLVAVLSLNKWLS